MNTMDQQRLEYRFLIVGTLIAISATIGFAQQVSFENGWKSIRIFQTTKTDLEKTYGEPTLVNERFLFESPNEVIEVIFSGERCTIPKLGERLYNLDKNTVIQYDVYLLNPTFLSQLKFNPKDYRFFRDSYHTQRARYRNPEHGVDIFTETDSDHGERVIGLRYYPTAEQEHNVTCEIK